MHNGSLFVLACVYVWSADWLIAICRMQRFGMNTYLYAPKDDYKHRLDWRELYTEEQAGMCLHMCLHVCVGVSFCLSLHV